MDSTTERFKAPKPGDLEAEAQQLRTNATLQALGHPTPQEAKIEYPTEGNELENLALFLHRLLDAGLCQPRRRRKKP